jgi:dipeptidyl aminopeptidase/acylaminoacyl peptidase
MKKSNTILSILLLALLFVTSTYAAEDGEILESTTVTLSTEQRAMALERMPGAADYLDSIEVRSITYSSDGLKVKGYLVIPNGEGPFPCLIVNRGGNRDFGAFSDMAAVLWLGTMANWGYVVIASQYRGVAGGEGIEEFGGADINDVLNLIPILDSIPEADASRIGMWGASRGGLMTYLALAKTDRIRAAVIPAGLSDSYDMVERRPGMETNVYSELVPDWETNRDAALRARSPVIWADKLSKKTPILLLHGSSDWRVDPSQTLNMADTLLRLNHPFRLVIFEGGDHGLTEYRDEENRMTREFFDHYVRDNSPLPDMTPHGR